MIAAHYGVLATEHEVARRCGTKAIGTHREALVRAARSFGLAAEALDDGSRDDIEAQLRDNSPLIAIVDPGVLYRDLPGFPHSVVVIGSTTETVTYHDPEWRPDLTASWTRFEWAWEACERKGVIICEPK